MSLKFDQATSYWAFAHVLNKASLFYFGGVISVSDAGKLVRWCFRISGVKMRLVRKFFHPTIKRQHFRKSKNKRGEKARTAWTAVIVSRFTQPLKYYILFRRKTFVFVFSLAAKNDRWKKKEKKLPSSYKNVAFVWRPLLIYQSETKATRK